MLERFKRLLDQVGDAGITLTQAGYLPPAHVEAVADILRLEDSWIGKNNREVQTYPVLEFRELAQRLGLLRKAHNRLTLTKAAIRARTDVNALWLGHRRTPARSEHPGARGSGAIRRKAHRDPAADGPPDGAGAAFAKATLGL